jgi:hypothetical protein
MFTEPISCLPIPPVAQDKIQHFLPGQKFIKYTLNCHNNFIALHYHWNSRIFCSSGLRVKKEKGTGKTANFVNKCNWPV